MVETFLFTSVLLALAAAGVDLVEVNPKADPPVCRLRDTEAMHKKEEKRKSKAARQARVDKGQMKKIRVSPRTDVGGVFVKSGQIAKMLKKGQTVQVFVLANSYKDKQIVHDKAIPLLTQLYEQVLVNCEEDECCWCAAVANHLSSFISFCAVFYRIPLTVPTQCP